MSRRPVLNLKARFGSKALLGVFSRSIFSDVVQAGVGVINTALIVRALGSTLTGYYFLMGAFFAPLPAILNSFDQVLTRFLPESTEKVRRELIAGVVMTKLYGTVIGTGILSLLWVLHITPAGLDDFSKHYSSYLVYLGGINFFVLPLLISWSGRTLAGYKDYMFTIRADLIQALVTTAWTTIVFLAPVLHRIDVLLLGTTAITLLNAIAKTVRISQHDAHLFRHVGGALINPRRDFATLFSGIHRRYYGPFFLMGISGYLKDQLPLVVVGNAVSPAAVTMFRIVQQIFRFANKFVPNAFEIVRPSLMMFNKRHATDNHMQAVKYQRLALLYLGMITIFSLAVIYGLQPILRVWALYPTPVLYLCATIFSVELLFLSAAHIEYQILLLQDSTGYVAWLSISRQIVASVVMLWAGNRFGMPGVALGTMAAALFTWAGFHSYAKRHSTRPSRLRSQAVMTVIALCALVVVAAIPTWESLL